MQKALSSQLEPRAPLMLHTAWGAPQAEAGHCFGNICPPTRSSCTTYLAALPLSPDSGLPVQQLSPFPLCDKDEQSWLLQPGKTLGKHRRQESPIPGTAAGRMCCLLPYVLLQKLPEGEVLDFELPAILGHSQQPPSLMRYSDGDHVSKMVSLADALSLQRDECRYEGRSVNISVCSKGQQYFGKLDLGWSEERQPEADQVLAAILQVTFP